MKIYYWPCLHSLAEYTPGNAIAYASSKARAIELIINGRDEAELELELNNTEPDVITSEWATRDYGSA